MKDVIKEIETIARVVFKILGTGHSERIYHQALISAMNKRNIPHRSEVPCPIWFLDECIGLGRADLVIEDVIVEIKANKMPPVRQSAQIAKYIISLSQTERRAYRGMIVNFNSRSGNLDVWHSNVRKSIYFPEEPLKEAKQCKYFSRLQQRGHMETP